MGAILSCFRRTRCHIEKESPQLSHVEFYYCRGRRPPCPRCEAEMMRENFENRQLRRWDSCGQIEDYDPSQFYSIPTPPPPPRVAGVRYNVERYRRNTLMIPPYSQK